VRGYHELPVLRRADLDPEPDRATTAASFLGCTVSSWLAARQRLGPVFRFDDDGREQLVICGREADLEAWRTPDAWSYGASDGGRFFRREMGPQHVTQLDGEAHRRHRKLVLPAFGIRALTRDFAAAAATLEQGLGALGEGPLDLYPRLAALYTRCLARTQVKLEAPEETCDRIAEFEEAFIAAVRLPPAQQQRWHDRPAYRALKAELFALFGEVVAARRAGERPGDSLDLLLDRPPPAGMAPLTDEELIRAVYLLLGAGVGNIANQVCATLWAVIAHPPWQQRLQEELARVAVSELAKGVGALPVLRAVLLEAERCYVPAPVIPKVASEDMVFLDCRIPRGTPVLHMHALAHFDDARYEDPLAYRPERWLDGDAGKTNAFGGGRHLCLGMGVARLYSPLTLALLCRDRDLVADQPPRYVPLDPAVDCSPVTTRFELRLPRCGPR